MCIRDRNKETAEREIENLKTDIANQQEYLDKSIWINMSPVSYTHLRQISMMALRSLAEADGMAM